MNALRANPCSLNLVPPAKKHKPRTCAHWSGQVSQCGRFGRSPIGPLTNTMDEEGRFRVSKGCSLGGLMGGMKLTEVTQDGANERRLDNAELAFHEREDLQNRFSSRGTDPRHVLRTATISSTLGAFETRQGVEAISVRLRQR